MKVIVLGAGVVGTATAYFLAKRLQARQHARADRAEPRCASRPASATAGQMPGVTRGGVSTPSHGDYWFGTS